MRVYGLIALLIVTALCLCCCSIPSSSTTKHPNIDYNPPKLEFPEFETIVLPDFDEFLGDATYTISYTARLSYNNHVGNSWGYGIEYFGERIESGISIEASKLMPLSFTAYATEFDSYNDHGYASVRFESFDIGETQTKEVTVTVRENRGRYSGNTAGWTFTITVERTA